MPAKFFITLLLLYPIVLFAQTPTTKPVNMLALSTGAQIMQPVTALQSLSDIGTKACWKGRYIWLARFTDAPTGSQKLQLEREGIVFLSKINTETYFISSKTIPTYEWLQQHKIGQTAVAEPELKLHKTIQNKTFPTDAKDDAGRMIAMVSIHPTISITEIKEWLRKNDFEIDSTVLENTSRVLTVHIPFKQLIKLAEMPFVVFIQPIEKARLLNEKVRVFSGGFLANAPLLLGGHNLKGKGVVVGLGDIGDASIHPDLAGRAINMTGGLVDNHGAHVSGTIAGSGSLQPDFQGVAPLATIVSRFLREILLNAAEYFDDLGMVVTNNSYASSFGFANYDSWSIVVDKQAFDLPVLLNVFAAGNSGDEVLNPFLPHFGTVLSGCQAAKNTITVGRVDFDQLASSSTSCGPVGDGRLKPEIMSLGVVTSTNSNIGYMEFNGTSQAAPGVTGGLVLLYERYRQLFAGQNPQGALIKAILLNGARDVGNKGPDYRHGYGLMHLENSLRMLDSHYYFGSDISTAATHDTAVMVPQGVAQFKVMLYWHDPAASPLATTALVNDIDLEVIAPDGTTTVYPKKLNPSPQNVADLATEGPDHINNSEQVVIDAPVPGKYTIRIKGYDVNTNLTQAYFTCFDFVPNALAIRTPVAGDNWSVVAPNEGGITGVIISWDDEGTPTGGSYTLQYSLNAGNSWTTIPADTLNPLVPLVLKDTCRYYGWRPLANTATNQAMVRVVKNGTSFIATSGIFSILNRPQGILVSKPCEGYLTVSWKPVFGATDYEVIMMQGMQMVPVAVVDSPYTYTIKGLNKDSTYYISVRARKDGIAGRYIYANRFVPNGGSCAGNISDGDLKLDSIVSPISGRQFTNNALGTAENIKIRVKNLDNVAVPAGSYDVKYSLDNGPFISKSGGPIGAQKTYVTTFEGADFSAAGTHVITAVVTNLLATDNVAQNDTFKIVVKNLANPLIVPTTDTALSFLEDFESAADSAYQINTIGLEGLYRWDYANNIIYDRLRTHIKPVPAFSGSKAISMDMTRQQSGTSNNQLLGTFNLSQSSLADEVRFDFQHKDHGGSAVPDDKNKIWVRGDQNAEWVEAYDLIANKPGTRGVWQRSASVELSDLLAAAVPAQNFSSSTQIKFGQSAGFAIIGNNGYAGTSIDDIRIYLASNDLRMLAIDVPAAFNCAVNNPLPIKVTVRNSMSYPIDGVKVWYSMNGADTVTETIPTPIAGNADFEYVFNRQYNFTLNNNYSITASVQYPGDNVLENNTLVKSIESPYIYGDFPARSVEGALTVSGQFPSWEWGKPKGIKIDTAASDSYAWKTSLNGHYNDNELSYLTSPCFDISNLANPTLSFSLAYDMEDCGNDGPCDAAWMEYSTDGITWQKLGKFGEGTNWYDNKNNTWAEQGHTYWHVATSPLPKTKTPFSFRFVMAANQTNSYEGIAIDDINVYDMVMPIYTQVGESGSITKPLPELSEANYSIDGKLVATLTNYGHDLGNVEVRMYNFNGPVRNNGSQYYGNRNITVKSIDNLPVEDVGVRLYFTDQEVDSLRLAKSCVGCMQLKDFTHLGVTQYSDVDRANEDGSLENNINGTNQFFGNGLVEFIPYGSGYYAQFYVSSFSEFWLNDGRGESIPLPNSSINLKASKQNKVNARLEWSTASEAGVDFYEVQSALSQLAADAGNFATIGRIFARNNGSATYFYTDERIAKSGDYYYRIKQVEKNGQVFYSPIRLLSFGKQQFDITLRPNPVKDNLWLAVQSDENKALQVKIVNITGQVIYLQNWPVSIGTSQLSIPLGKLAIGKGVYTVGVGDGKSWWYGKVLKQ